MLNCVGRKWDPAVSRVGIGRTAALGGVGGCKAGAHSVGLLSLSCAVRADYCICVAAAAHKMAAGRRRGREEVGGPPGWEGKLGCPAAASVHLAAWRAGSGARAGTLLPEEPPDAVARAEERERPLGSAVAAPSPSGPGLPRPSQA